MSAIMLSMFHNISARSTEWLLTAGCQLAGPSLATQTSEPVENLDHNSCSSNEESYRAEDGLVGERYVRRANHCPNDTS